MLEDRPEPERSDLSLAENIGQGLALKTEGEIDELMLLADNLPEEMRNEQARTLAFQYALIQKELFEDGPEENDQKLYQKWRRIVWDMRKGDLTSIREEFKNLARTEYEDSAKHDDLEIETQGDTYQNFANLLV